MRARRRKNASLFLESSSGGVGRGMQTVERDHEVKDVDLSAAGRGVWLVKVPKYLSEKWAKTSGNCEVGKLKITRSRVPGQKPDVIFTLNDQLARAEAGKPPIPKDHKFVLTGIGKQNFNVLSQVAIPLTGPESGSGGRKEGFTTDRLSIEGKVIQRAECRPVASDTYMKLKRLQLEAKNKPVHEIKQLDTIVQTYKPVKDHAFIREHEQRKKGEGKNIRKEKGEVMDMLFSAFEKHQYYNVRDLVGITKQPVTSRFQDLIIGNHTFSAKRNKTTYLKEILKELCTYNMKAPHKNMWELKPEYRHYKDQNRS